MKTLIERKVKSLRGISNGFMLGGLLVLTVISCKQKEYVFSKVSSSKTGISFENNLEDLLSWPIYLVQYYGKYIKTYVYIIYIF